MNTRCPALHVAVLVLASVTGCASVEEVTRDDPVLAESKLVERTFAPETDRITNFELTPEGKLRLRTATVFGCEERHEDTYTTTVTTQHMVPDSTKGWTYWGLAGGCGLIGCGLVTGACMSPFVFFDPRAKDDSGAYVPVDEQPGVALWPYALAVAGGATVLATPAAAAWGLAHFSDYEDVTVEPDIRPRNATPSACMKLEPRAGAPIVAVTASGRQVLGKTDQAGAAVLDLDAILPTIAAADAPARLQADLGDEAMSLYVDVETADGFAKKVTVRRIGGKSVSLDAGQFPALAALNQAKQDEIDSAAQRAEEERLAALRREQEAHEAREARAKEVTAACDEIEFTDYIEPTAEGAAIEQMLKEAEQDVDLNQHALVRLCRRRLATKQSKAQDLMLELGLAQSCASAATAEEMLGVFFADCTGFTVRLSLVDKPGFGTTKEMTPTLGFLQECRGGGRLLKQNAKRLLKKAKKQRKRLKSKDEDKPKVAEIYKLGGAAAKQCLEKLEAHGPGIEAQLQQLETLARSRARQQATPAPTRRAPSRSLGSDWAAQSEARRAREEAERAKRELEEMKRNMPKKCSEDWRCQGRCDSDFYDCDRACHKECDARSDCHNYQLTCRRCDRAKEICYNSLTE